MKLKLDENGHAVVEDGKPVYIHDDGKEVAFDAPGTVATISRLNGEAKSHRERAERAEKTLKNFEGIDDPQAARAALETVKNLDRKKLVDAGEVEKVKQEIAKAFQAQQEELRKQNEELASQNYKLQVGGSFANSRFIRERLTIPPDLVEARFGQNFKVEEGKIVAYDNAGNKLYSPQNPGQPASFEEAIQALVEQYPAREHILKGSGGSGTGTAQSNGATGKRSISLSDQNALNANLEAIAKGEVSVVG